MLKVLSQEIHGSRSHHRLLCRTKRQVKAGHWLEDFHHRAVARGHNDSKNRRKPLHNGGFFDISSLRCGTAHNTVIIREHTLELINHFLDIQGNRTVGMLLFLERTALALLIFQLCPLRLVFQFRPDNGYGFRVEHGPEKLFPPILKTEFVIDLVWFIVHGNPPLFYH